MSRGASGHITAGGSGYFYHNDRSHDTKNSIFSDEKNEYSSTATEAMKLYRKELRKRTKAYTARTGQKLQKNIATHRSMIVNLEKHHTLKDLKKIKEWLEVSLDTKVLQIAIHRDEGYVEKETGKAVKNYHAHIEMLGIDSYGMSIAQQQYRSKYLKAKKNESEEKKKERKKLLAEDLKEIAKKPHTRANRLDSKFYTKLQTFLANTLEMERGKRGSKAKRLDTYEYKREAEIRSDIAFAKVKNVKKQFKEEKQTLVNRHTATQIDYTNLRKKYKELEEKTRKKDLTIENLEKEVYSEKWKTKDRKLVKNKDVVVYLKKQLAESQNELKEQKAENSILRAENSSLEDKEFLEMLKDNEIRAFKAKIRPLTSLEIQNTKDELLKQDDQYHEEKRAILREDFISKAKQEQTDKKPIITRADLRSDTLKLQKSRKFEKIL